MSRSIAVLLALATSAAMAQAQSGGAPGTSPNVQTQPAPVVRAYPGADSAPEGGYGPGGSVSQITSLRPISGVVVRVPADASVKTLSADAKGTELLVEHGRVNVSVRQPTQDSELLVDLPGGQVSLLKDGFYTFNADTKTVRVLKGEADAYPGPIGPGVKGIKVKEGREVAFGASGSVRAVDADPQQLWADVLPQTGGGGEPARGYGYGYPGYGYPGYGYGPYGDGYYGYPYPGYAWGYPGLAWGYPYGFGFGVGFGYYGGFRGGYGYRGYWR
jgi:hypothetical protein